MKFAIICQLAVRDTLKTEEKYFGGFQISYLQNLITIRFKLRSSLKLIFRTMDTLRETVRRPFLFLRDKIKNVNQLMHTVHRLLGSEIRKIHSKTLSIGHGIRP